MPISTRPDRYASPGPKGSGQSQVVPPIKMPLLHALLRGQSPGTLNSPRAGYGGSSTPGRRTTSTAGRQRSGSQHYHGHGATYTPGDKSRYTNLSSPQTPSSPRVGHLSRQSSFGSTTTPLVQQRSPATSHKVTPIQLSRKSSAASTNDTIGHSDSTEGLIAPSSVTGRRFNTPGRAPSPGTSQGGHHYPRDQKDTAPPSTRRRALSAHSAAGRGKGSSELSSLATSTSSLLKGLLDASRTLSPRKVLNSTNSSYFTSTNGIGSTDSPHSKTTAPALNNSFTRSPFTPASLTQHSSAWSPSSPAAPASTPTASTPQSFSTPQQDSTPSKSHSHSQKHQSKVPPVAPEMTPVAGAATSSGRKVPSHISNMVCSWTANGQEDQAKYGENGYMRVKKGMVMDKRYHIISKLGWGEFATVWLAWDQESLRKKLTTKTSQFVAIKVSKCAEHVSNAAKEEANLLKFLGKHARGSGSASLSTVLNVFNQQGEHGVHVCMVFPVLGQNILCLVEQAHRHRNKIRGITSPASCPKRPTEDIAFVKSCLRASLRALSELARLNVLHTDLKPENILLTTVSQKTRETMREWQDAVAKLRGTPWDADRLIDTDDVVREGDKESSYIRVSDFGLSSLIDPDAASHGIGMHARRLQCKKKGVASNPLGVILQTREYRAPEVLFGNTLTPTTDVWSVGCMAFELVTGTFLMDPKKDPKRRPKEEEEINNDHICMMQQLIGPVPQHVAKGPGRHLPKYFTEDGRFKQQDKADKHFQKRGLKDELLCFLHERDAELMASFVLECLGSYDATARPSADMMLKHPFLTR